MLDFASLIKFIRNEAQMTQQEFADLLEISKVLLVKVENKTKDPSKKLVNKLASKLKVHPSVLMPFIAITEANITFKPLSSLEKKLLNVGTELQEKLLKKRANQLSKSHGKLS